MFVNETQKGSFPLLEELTRDHNQWTQNWSKTVPYSMMTVRILQKFKCVVITGARLLKDILA